MNIDSENEITIRLNKTEIMMVEQAATWDHLTTLTLLH